MRLFFFICLLLSFCVYAEESSQLQVINKQIDDVKAQLSASVSQQEKSQKMLKDLDLDISKTVLALKKTQAQLEKTQATLKTLDVQYAEALKHLTTQQEGLSEQVRSAFLLGQMDMFKMLLNQNDPHAMGRLLTYFDYFNLERSRIMQQVQTDMDALVQIKTKQQQSQEKLQAINEEHTQAYAHLSEQKQAQAELVAKLLADINEKNLTLETLTADKKALESVVVKVKTQKTVFIGDTSKPLRDYQGKLPWPVQGAVVHRFGDAVIADNKWQGIMIAAPEGTDVNAVYKGRVVYADWLRGFGLIIIVDHGQGYMSLYAHNQSLYKNAGDWVDMNEPIAQVGKSGPIANTGLYFEIRSKGEVQNPMSWLVPKT